MVQSNAKIADNSEIQSFVASVMKIKRKKVLSEDMVMRSAGRSLQPFKLNTQKKNVRDMK